MAGNVFCVVVVVVVVVTTATDDVGTVVVVVVCAVAVILLLLLFICCELLWFFCLLYGNRDREYVVTLSLFCIAQGVVSFFVLVVVGRLERVNVFLWLVQEEVFSKRGPGSCYLEV